MIWIKWSTRDDLVVFVFDGLGLVEKVDLSSLVNDWLDIPVMIISFYILLLLYTILSYYEDDTINHATGDLSRRQFHSFQHITFPPSPFSFAFILLLLLPLVQVQQVRIRQAESHPISSHHPIHQMVLSVRFISHQPLLCRSSAPPPHIAKKRCANGSGLSARTKTSN